MNWTVGQSRDVHFALEITISFRSAPFFSLDAANSQQNMMFEQTFFRFSFWQAKREIADMVNILNMLRKSTFIDWKQYQ